MGLKHRFRLPFHGSVCRLSLLRHYTFRAGRLGDPPPLRFHCRYCLITSPYTVTVPPCG